MRRPENDLLRACHDDCPWLRAVGWLGFLAMLGISVAHMMRWL